MNVVKIMAVGDIMLGDDHLHIGRGVGSIIRKKGAKFPFQKVSPVLQKADICFGNLEAPLCKLSQFGLENMKFRGAPSSIEGLKYAGFNFLSVANNHIMEHGKEAFVDTVKKLLKYDIYAVGQKNREEYSSKPSVINKSGMSIGFLGYSLIKTQYKQTPLYAEGNINKILSEVKTLSHNVSVIIVSLHWGYEYTNFPSPEQVDMAHKIIDSGAQMIIGHHPHILQPIEAYNKGLVAYSLGNFIFDMDWSDTTRTGGILEIEISENKDIQWDLIPTFINRDFQPEMLPKRPLKNILQEFETNFTNMYGNKLEYQRYASSQVKWGSARMRRYVMANFFKLSIFSLYLLVKAKVLKILSRFISLRKGD